MSLINHSVFKCTRVVELIGQRSLLGKRRIIILKSQLIRGAKHDNNFNFNRVRSVTSTGWNTYDWVGGGSDIGIKIPWGHP